MASFLSAAIAGTLDRIALFNRDGQPVLLFDGMLHVVNSERLACVLDGYFATVHVVQLGGRLELEYRGARTNELVMRQMLTAESKHGGLVEKLPPLVIERPQVAVEEKPQEATSSLPEVQRELEAGARQVARHADSDKKRELEMKRGAEVVARHAGRQVAVEPAPVVEEHPVFVENQEPPAHVPAEAKDRAADPARPQQA
jgi:hypothetical protein